MKVRVAVTATLFTCKRCGAEHNNMIKHTCVVSFSQLGPPASMRKKTKR